LRWYFDIADNVATATQINKRMSELSKQILIRPLAELDCSIISDAFASQGWNKPREKFEQYRNEQEAGSRAVFIAEFHGEFAGYVSVLYSSDYPPFRDSLIPEIVDLNVLKKYQGCGVGSRLIDAAEHLIAERGSLAGIRVGLTADYGAAQRLYIKRGYVPDGYGISHRRQFLKYGEKVVVDDDLTIAFTKNCSDNA